MTGAGFVRAAREADALALAEVQVASWRDGYAGVVPADLLGELTGAEAMTAWQQRWREAIVSPPTSRHRVLVAVSSGSEAGLSGRVVVGFASAGPATDSDRWPATDAELYELRIRPEETRRGHGGRLLHAVAETLADDGFHTACTWALVSDTALLGFLESAGWTADGARAELDVGVRVPTIRLHTAISELHRSRVPGLPGECAPGFAVRTVT